MTLYLKYRPKLLSELDLDGVRTSLANILSSVNPPHALLFSGPKGTGKTSSARIVAKILNCEKGGVEPCNECESCLAIAKGSHIDVIEMDAASNRGIDDIRALKQEAMLTPSIGKKKIYIIDEAHMLTNEAANALLKTLEEPPAHVFFILATTDPQKLPATIHSRLTTVQFTKATGEEIARQLERVAKGENLKLEDGVIAQIAQIADGSFRDAVKTLESISHQEKNITKEIVQKFISGSAKNTDELLETILKKDVVKALSLIQQVVSSGGSVKYCIDSLIESIRLKLINGVIDGSLDVEIQDEYICFLQKLIVARADTGKSSIVELPLELAVISWCGGVKKDSESKKKLEKAEETDVTNQPYDTKPSQVEVVEIKTDQIQTIQPILKDTDMPTNESGLHSDLDEISWMKIVSSSRDRNTTVDALLRACRPLSFDGRVLNLGVYYQFHKEQLEVSNNKLALEQITSDVLGAPVQVQLSLTERTHTVIQEKPDLPLEETKEEDILSAAKEIFGS